MVENVDELARRTDGAALSPGDYGRSIRGAIQQKADASMKSVNEAYDLARKTSGETLTAVGDDIIDLLQTNEGFEGVGGLIKKAEGLGIVKRGDDGRLVAQSVPIKNLQELRSSASSLSAGGKSKGYNAGVLKSKIDDVFDKQGGELYRDAAKLRRAHAQEFERRGSAVERILKTKGGKDTDLAIADEDLFNKVVVGGSVKDSVDLIDFLADSGKADQVKNLRAQTIDFLKDAATKGGDTPTPEFRLAALERAVKKMGGHEKLRAILGDDMANGVQDIIDAGNILFRQTPNMTAGSQTASRLSRAFEKLADYSNKIPVVGSFLSEPFENISASVKTKEALTDVAKTTKNALTKSQKRRARRKIRNQRIREASGLSPAAGINALTAERE